MFLLFLLVVGTGLGAGNLAIKTDQVAASTELFPFMKKIFIQINI